SGTGTGTVVNDDTAPSFSITAAVSHNEGNSGTTAYDFTVTKTGATDVTATVDYASADGSATVANSDYSAVSGTLTFTAGGPNTQTVTVLVNGDVNFELDETFTVNLSSPTFATISSGTGT